MTASEGAVELVVRNETTRDVLNVMKKDVLGVMSKARKVLGIHTGMYTNAHTHMHTHMRSTIRKYALTHAHIHRKTHTHATYPGFYGLGAARRELGGRDHSRKK